jgi:hypothetical protein
MLISHRFSPPSFVCISAISGPSNRRLGGSLNLARIRCSRLKLPVEPHRLRSMNAPLLSLAFAALLSGIATAKDYTIAVIPKGTTHEFWKSIHTGAAKAEQELNAQGVKTKIFWKGPLREDDRDQQIQVVENFTSRGVSGIVLAPLDSRALVQPVKSAVQAGVPVVVMDSGPQVRQARQLRRHGQLQGRRPGRGTHGANSSAARATSSSCAIRSVPPAPRRARPDFSRRSRSIPTSNSSPAINTPARPARRVIRPPKTS